jgi:hypothetical protein
MYSNNILGIAVILFFTGLSIGVVIFLVRAKKNEVKENVRELNEGVLGIKKDVKDNEGIRVMKDKQDARDVKESKGLGDVKEVTNPLSNSTPLSKPTSTPIPTPTTFIFKNSSSQTPNDPIHDLLKIFKKEDDSFAFTRGEDGNLLLICSLKIPFESISVKEENDVNNANLRKVIKNAVTQYISIRNPNDQPHFISNFLKDLYNKKESFIGGRISKTFMPDDIFEIVKKTIRGLREFYKTELSELNSKTVICLLYNLEDKIVNNETDIGNDDEDEDDDDSYNTFLSLFFTNDHFDFIQDVRTCRDLYKKKKKYLLKLGLEGKPVLCTQDNPKMDYDILDFIIYVCSKVLTNTISNKIY